MTRFMMLLFSVSVFLAFGSLNAAGETPISNCTVIDRPGSYALANNIKATQRSMKGPAPACIFIVADFVTLDLEGYTITGPGTGFGIYSTVGSTGRRATHVRNGAVTNFERSIALEGDGHTAEDVRVAFSGAGLTLDGSGIRVERVHAVSNGGDGILCFGGGGHSVRHSEVNINNGIGINLAACPGSSIIGNTVSVNTGDGIVAQCPSVVLQNMAFQNAGTDILADPVACTRSDNNPAP